MLINHTDKTIPITVFARTTAPPAAAFDAIADIDLSTVFLADRFFPGVAGVRGQTDTWDHAGVTRHPQFTDGSQATETLTEWVPGHGFAYELTTFTNALASLAIGVRGEFSFLPDGGGSVIRWTYEFKPRRGRGWIVAGPFKALWKRYMQAGLARMAGAADEAHAATTRSAA